MAFNVPFGAAGRGTVVRENRLFAPPLPSRLFEQLLLWPGGEVYPRYDLARNE
jgi:hypothetical protein